MKALIVDDEKPARGELRFLLINNPYIEECGEVSDGATALNYIKVHKPDLVFLDIQMPELSGIDVAEELLECENPPSIIFVTAYDTYALKAFEIHAQDYLLKPVEKKRLYSSIERLIKNPERQRKNVESVTGLTKTWNKEHSKKHITVMRDGRFYPLKFSDIKYASAQGKITLIYTTNGCFKYKNGLHRLESGLPDDFIKTHRSYIVNIRFIENIDMGFNSTYLLSLKNEEEKVPVSRSYMTEFKEIMNMEV